MKNSFETTTVRTINPYIGRSLIPNDQIIRSKLKDGSVLYKNYVLNDRQLCDLELLLNGGFSPLEGFMNEEMYNNVVNNMRLYENGPIFPIPITLDISQKITDQIKIGQKLTLRDSEYNFLAILNIESIWKPDKSLEALKVFGSEDDICHPAINYLFNIAGDYYVGGKLEGYQLPPHYDFVDFRLTPSELKQLLINNNIDEIVGFQTRNPMHRSHRELTLLAASELNKGQKGAILIHPVVGMTKPGDIDHYTRVKVYQEILKTYPKEQPVFLSLLPLAMRMAGPREALWHSIIRKNYGCTHFVVGRDHAGPGKNKDGQDFYDPYAAQELVIKHQHEIGIKVLTYKMIVYVENLDTYKTIDQINETDTTLSLSGTELRHRLYNGLDIPNWFSYPKVVKILRESYPPLPKQGFTIFFTGLSGSGKSTLAQALRIRLLQDPHINGRSLTLLDGDVVRQNLSSELTFSQEHRNLNIKRIGYVASEISKAGGIVVCAAIAPHDQSRKEARLLVTSKNSIKSFIQIYVKTPLNICEQRDRKGLYLKARQGLIKNFTGIDDPYNIPHDSEIEIDTSQMTIEEALNHILDHIRQLGYI